MLAALLAAAPAIAQQESKAAQQVRAAELAFAAAAQAKDFEKFMSFVDDDARAFQEGRALRGREQFRANWAAGFANPGWSITWTPQHVEAADTLGYTTGPFEVRVKRAEGDIVRRGHYVTMWRRKADGTWKVALDIGTFEPPPAAKPEAKQP